MGLWIEGKWYATFYNYKSEIRVVHVNEARVLLVKKEASVVGEELLEFIFMLV